MNAHSPSKRRLPAAIHLALIGALSVTVLGTSLTTSAWAQDSSAQYHFDIPAGPLEAAIARFSSITGSSISFQPGAASQQRSPGLQGNHGVLQGLQQLLGGSNLQAVELGSGSFTLIVRDKAMTLEATSITGSSLRNSATTEGTGSYTTGVTSTATKMNLSIRETPQSVSVVTRQQIEDQGLSTINDAAMKTPGLNMQKNGAERYNLYARGFPVDNIMYDGLPIDLNSTDTISPANLAMYDRVEIVRGANGLIQGTGNPSAAINLVRKRPTAEFQSSINLSAGSWDNYRSELDVSGPLIENGKLRGRAVASYQDGNSFQDELSKEHSLFYAIGEAEISDSTTLTLSYNHQNENNNVAWGGGLPTAVNGGDLHLSRSTSFLANWEYWDKEMDTLHLELQYRFDNDWALRVSGNRSWSSLNYYGGYPARRANNLGSLRYNVSGGQYKDTQSSYDIYLNGPFQLLNRTHEIVLGYSYRENDYDTHGSGTTAVATDIDPHSFDPGSWAKPSVNLYDFMDIRDMTQEGLYATGRFTLNDQLKLIVGTRLDWYDYQYLYNWKGDISITEAKETRHLTRYAGLLYDLDQNHTLYTSYTDIFQPQSNRNTSGQLIDPIEGKNYEVGIKGEYFDGALNASIAIFLIDQENRSSEVDDPTTCNVYPSSTCYEPAGKVRSKGIEIELNGAITPAWQLAAGYAFAEAKYKKDANTANEGKLFDTDIPRHQFKATSMYNLPNALNRWRVGASFYYQSAVYNEGTTSGQNWKVEQEDYSVIDLITTYKASEHLDLRFALNNLLDEKYYQSIGQNISTWPTTFYGAPRNFQVSATYRF
ncbi:TonB-dependent siderophore receptor [Pseudomonas sp. ABC1]|uniref:TonB-dependent siderophore receptor n=1 Tax=Pseudomonas sp. ABC1 TaxID=2748080 RepID=UPI0015C3DD0B|nr:TonB-dependent siderophore receptor [Pseudomonas sp. ABC1]QLF93341.1 TonB-dependent siderophore receptor [Pseudomonas sp. ABC1]